MDVGRHSPHPRTQQRQKQGHFIKAHISHLSNYKDTREAPSSLHNSKDNNTPTQHGYKTQPSTVIALHTLLNNTVKKVQPIGSPCANNNCSTRYEQSFRHNKHTHTNQKAATVQHSMHNHEVRRKLHQGMQGLYNIQKPDIHIT